MPYQSALEVCLISYAVLVGIYSLLLLHQISSFSPLVSHSSDSSRLLLAVLRPTSIFLALFRSFSIFLALSRSSWLCSRNGVFLFLSWTLTRYLSSETVTLCIQFRFDIDALHVGAY